MNVSPGVTEYGNGVISVNPGVALQAVISLLIPAFGPDVIFILPRTHDPDPLGDDTVPWILDRVEPAATVPETA